MTRFAWACLALFIAPTLCRADDKAFRFFFDFEGVGETAARPADTPLAFTNPVVTGAGRLYMYFQYFDDDENFSGLSLRVEASGPAQFTGGKFYNHGAVGVTRWQAVTGSVAPSPGSTSWVINSFFKVGGGGYGLRNNDGAGNAGPDVPGGWQGTQQADTHYRHDDGSAFGTTLIGYADLVYSGSQGGPDAELRFWTGDTAGNGCDFPPACDTLFVYFGFGDAGTAYRRDWTSQLPDALIRSIPEPLTIGLLAAAIAAGFGLNRMRRCSIP